MDHEAISLKNYSEKEIEVLKRFIYLTLDELSWPYDFINYASAEDIKKLKYFKYQYIIRSLCQILY